MASKVVLVHRCEHAEMDDGGSLDCSYKMKISLTQARGKIGEGSAVWKKAPIGRRLTSVYVCTGLYNRRPRRAHVSHINEPYQSLQNYG
jgi:hypothetical protein